MATDLDVTEGTLPGGLPYFRLGSGPRLIVLRGFTTTHDNPKSLQRKFEVGMLTPLARRFDVYAVNRAPGLAPGSTMAQISTQHADAFRAEFGGPVDLLGMSSGGSIALQVAADHPDVVRRLVLVGAAYRIGETAAAAQMRYIDAVAEGRRGAQHLAAMKVSSAIGARLLAPIMWLADPLVRPKDPSDMVAFARAEDKFDLGARLDDVTAPTLVIAGERDNVYGQELLKATADKPRVSVDGYRSAMSRYTWDPRKAMSNLWKHGVTFEEAETVELDPYRRRRPDLLHDPEYERFLLLGYSAEGWLLLVVTSERGPRPRIISARRATKRERHAYEARP